MRKDPNRGTADTKNKHEDTEDNLLLNNLKHTKFTNNCSDLNDFQTTQCGLTPFLI